METQRPMKTAKAVPSKGSNTGGTPALMSKHATDP